ncbi:MAG: hypothetical protein M3547_05340 [Acidobacteriota bacterium]|nr:hypothetical protein [Acidobacteriota bacterium]
MSIDLNGDVGEGMDDAALLPFVTSANVTRISPPQRGHTRGSTSSAPEGRAVRALRHR